MGRLWLQADYVKCIHGSGERYTRYNAVMESWELAFNWNQGVAFQIRNVRARVLQTWLGSPWKFMSDMESVLFPVTNIYEFHNGQWHMVYQHSPSCSWMERRGIM